MTGFTPSQRETIHVFHPLERILKLERNTGVSPQQDYQQKRFSVFYNHSSKRSQVNLVYNRYIPQSKAYAFERITLQHFSLEQKARCASSEKRMEKNHVLGKLFICARFINRGSGANRRRFVQARIFVQRHSGEIRSVVRYYGYPARRLFSMLKQLKPQNSSIYTTRSLRTPEELYQGFYPFERLSKIRKKGFVVQNSRIDWSVDKEKPDLFLDLQGVSDKRYGFSRFFKVQFSQNTFEKLHCSGSRLTYTPKTANKIVYELCLQNTYRLPRASSKVVVIEAQPSRVITNNSYRITMKVLLSEFLSTLDLF